jgi:hypothetical protein
MFTYNVAYVHREQLLRNRIPNQLMSRLIYDLRILICEQIYSIHRPQRQEIKF